jgi:hypothetical protein
MVTLLTETSEIQTSADAGEALWLTGADALEATGWELKPEGFCKDDVCVPTPAGDDGGYVRGDEVNVSAFWQLMGKPAAASQDGDVWFLGEGAATRNDALLSLQAPDFTLPDFSGRLHSLTDFRRKKVLLITWASW